MKTAAIIVAAGRGSRAGGALPKQWQMLCGKPVVEHTVNLFENHPAISQIILVIAQSDQQLAQMHGLHRRTKLAIGGAERAASVLAGLRACDAEHVLIHDAARCTLPPEVITRVLTALETHAAAAPALPVSDALWHGTNGWVTGLQERAGLYRAQTPQGFHRAAIIKAHDVARISGQQPAADDVEVARRAGLDVFITEGDERNLKITHPADFARAEQLLKAQMQTTPPLLDIRTGNGFDVHRFGSGDQITLCGISIPFQRGLQGHSDADVGMHAVTDALYGAMAEGDIGQHFPPSDPQWKGASSDIFLRHACELAKARGFSITHIDCTLICEFPKIGPHAQLMRGKMAEIMGLESGRISVKATTSERLGFTGRGEGIAAMATATLVKS